VKTRGWTVVVPACIVLAGMGSAHAQGYTVLDGGVPDGGTLTGKIVFSGTPPAPTMLTIDQDVEACGGDRPAADLMVGADGGIANVMVSIEGIGAGKDWALSEEFVYDQKNCTFVPRILLIRPGQSGVVLNSDTVGHNFHTISRGIFNTNNKINPDAEMAVQGNRIRRPGAVEVKCDIHSWMAGWWHIAATPYTVLTDAAGAFSIDQVPPGTYTLKVWHETLGESEQEVVIGANGNTEVSVSLAL